MVRKSYVLCRLRRILSLILACAENEKNKGGKGMKNKGDINKFMQTCVTLTYEKQRHRNYSDCGSS